MATRASRTDADPARLAGYVAILTTLAGIGHAVWFVILKADVASAEFLLVGSVLSLGVLVTRYARLANVEPTLAGLALVLAAVGAAGAALHPVLRDSGPGR